MTGVPAGGSVRWRTLSRLLAAAAGRRTGFLVPEMAVVPRADIPVQAREDEGAIDAWAAGAIDDLLRRTAHLPSDHLFARALPHDEALRPDLSFAGVYASYAPRRATPRRENLLRGVAKVLRGRYRAYSDYYYARHAIRGERGIDLMFSSLLEDAAAFGTGYVHDGRCLLECFDTPLSIFLADPLRIAATEATPRRGLGGALVGVLFEVAGIVGGPVDVEFLVDRKERVYVTQVRPIPPRHLCNWRLVPAGAWAEVERGAPPSNVASTVGAAEGEIVDLRGRPPEDRDGQGTEGRVHLVSHRAAPGGTGLLDFLRFAARKGLSGVSLIVDHGSARTNDHLQFIALEDPGFRFVANATDVPPDLDGARRRVESDGFRITLAAAGR